MKALPTRAPPTLDGAGMAVAPSQCTGQGREKAQPTQDRGFCLFRGRLPCKKLAAPRSADPPTRRIRVRRGESVCRVHHAPPLPCQMVWPPRRPVFVPDRTQRPPERPRMRSRAPPRGSHRALRPRPLPLQTTIHRALGTWLSHFMCLSRAPSSSGGRVAFISARQEYPYNSL